MSKKDIRWVQRLNNYCAALDGLKEEVELSSERTLSSLEIKGVIKSFEYTYELAWNVIKDFYESAGETKMHGSADAFLMAFKRGLVPDGTLIRTINSRRDTVHTYNQETAEKIYSEILDEYYAAFEQLRSALLKQKDERGV